MKRPFKVICTTLAMTLCSVAMSQNANAAFIAAICDDLACSGNNDIVVTDNGAGDTNAALGGITFSVQNFAGFSLVVNTAQSKPLIGSSSSPQLDINYAATSGAGGGTVYLYAVDTDFTDPAKLPLAYTLSLGGTNSGNSGTVSGMVIGGNTNNNFPNAFLGQPTIATIGPLSGSAIASSNTGSFVPGQSPFSLALEATITRTTAGTSTGDLNFSASPVPEPATISLFGLCLIGMGFMARRRISQNS